MPKPGCTSMSSEALMAALQKPSPKDWPEDFNDENGNYANVCCICDHTFYGHKGRVSCKPCTKKQRDLMEKINA